MMLESLNPPRELPDEQPLARLKERVASSITAVRPLPSDNTIFAIGLSMFLVLSMLLALPVGYQGLLRLSELQRVFYYAAILGVAALFSLAIVPEIVPGARRRVNPLALIIVLLVLLLVPVALFQNFDLTEFVKHGIPCLRFGLICAGISAGIGFWLVTKGYASSPAQLGIIFGAFAGLVGVAALALHCPILNAAHIIVWHCGAILISGLAGVSLGALPLRNK